MGCCLLDVDQYPLGAGAWRHSMVVVSGGTCVYRILGCVDGGRLEGHAVTLA